MLSMRTLLKSSVLFATVLFFASCGGSESDKSDGENGDQSQSDTASSAKKKGEGQATMSTAKFANAVRKRILEKAKKEGGHLKLPDPRKKDDSLEVKLKNVVESTVVLQEKDVRYVCAKFKGVKDGKDYDIDFFMEGNEPSSLKAAREPIVHKVDGKARYKYEEEDGVMRPKKIVENKKKKQEEENKDQKKKNMKKAKEADEGKAGIQ